MATHELVGQWNNKFMLDAFGCTISGLPNLPHTILFKRTLEIKQDVLKWERIHNIFLSLFIGTAYEGLLRFTIV